VTAPLFLRRLESAGIGLFGGIAVAWLVGDANYGALGAAALFAVLALAFTRALTPAASRPDVYLLVGLALTLRYAVAVIVHDGSLAAGKGGFVTGDDANYADFSWILVQVFRGQPVASDYGGYLYLLGTFVYLETAIFALVGPNVVVVELLNAALGAAFVAIVCDLSRRLFENERTSLIAGALVAFYPSLVLWTSLNLKDSLALFLIAIVLWLLAVFQARPRWWLVPLMYVPVLPMESLRSYIFVGLSLIIPISIATTPHRKIPERAATTAIALTLSLLLLVMNANPAGAIRPLSDFDAERAAMGVGASTSFADQPLVARVAYVLLAPFPWSPRRALDLVTAPEMVIWYAALAAALLTVIRRIRSWRTLTPLILFAGGTLFVLLLAEGNVGTLFRHRAMVIPFVEILAAPTIASLLGPLLNPRPVARSVGVGVRSAVKDTRA